ncbi:MAG: hypothetical protein WBG37_17415 [Desulfobacterales bacterium]|jgi:hypothetical protein
MTADPPPRGLKPARRTTLHRGRSFDFTLEMVHGRQIEDAIAIAGLLRVWHALTHA